MAGAQEELRELVGEYARSRGREWMQKKCSMQRFDAFYEYYRSFVSEVQAGPMARRLSKPRKCLALERIHGKSAI